MAATKTRRTSPVLTVTDHPDEVADPFTVTGDHIRMTINSYDGQLVANLITGHVRVVSTLLVADADDLPLGTGAEFLSCYRHYPTPSIDSYAAHLTGLLQAEIAGGLL